MSFREFLNESSNEHVYFVKDVLWIAYGMGSGMTAYMPDKRKYLSSDYFDDNFDDIVNRIEKWSKHAKPIKKTSGGNTKMYEIPYYEYDYGKTFDIWGGTMKPNGKIYMIITEEKNTVLNFFESKNEALSWMRSTV